MHERCLFPLYCCMQQIKLTDCQHKTNLILFIMINTMLGITISIYNFDTCSYCYDGERETRLYL